MNKIFQEHIRKMMECYMDDIAVKGHLKGDHLLDMKKVLKIMCTIN